MQSGSRSTALILLSLVLLWEVAVRLLDIKPILLPAPSMILQELASAPWFYLRQSGDTLLTTVVGFVLAVVLGVGLAVGIVYPRVLERVIYTLLVSLNSLPKVALAPLFVIWMGTGVEPKIAIAVAGIMVYSAWGVGRSSLDQLMDRELPDEERARITAIMRNHAAVRSLHDLRTRSAGLSTFIQVHIEMDPAISLAEAHAVSDAVERDLENAFPGAEVIIHQDPEGLESQTGTVPD